MADLSSTDFLVLAVEGLSFLAFFSGTGVGGEDNVPVSLTAPISATVEGSTKVLSLPPHASLFFNLYGVASWACCSGIKTIQNLHSVCGLSTHGSFPLPLSLQHVQKACPSKLAKAWPQLPLFCPSEDMLIYTLSKICVSNKNT